jgi:hypothetical protein
LIFTTKAPEYPPAPPVHITCTTTRAAPIVDTILAALEVARTVVAVNAEDSVYKDAPFNRSADIGFGVGFAALFAGSAIYGFSVTNRCSELNRGREQEYAPEPQRQAQPAARWDPNRTQAPTDTDGRWSGPSPTPSSSSSPPPAPAVPSVGGSNKDR